MDYLPLADRNTLAETIATIINNRPPLTTLNLDSFSGATENESEHGELILDALSSSGISSIIVLALGMNKMWWRCDSCCEMLPEVVAKQVHIEQLSLHSSYFTSDLT